MPSIRVMRFWKTVFYSRALFTTTNTKINTGAVVSVVGKEVPELWRKEGVWLTFLEGVGSAKRILPFVACFASLCELLGAGKPTGGSLSSTLSGMCSGPLLWDRSVLNTN